MEERMSNDYTAGDLREGLGRIFTLLGILQRPLSKEKKRAFNNQYTEIVAEGDKDKLSYIYQFIAKMASKDKEYPAK